MNRGGEPRSRPESGWFEWMGRNGRKTAMTNGKESVVRGGKEDAEAVHRREELTARTDKTNDGGRGPKSALEGGKGSPEEAAKKKAIEYSVQLHTDAEGHGLKTVSYT